MDIKSKIWSTLIALSFGASVTVRAAVINAASLSFIDVSKAVYSATTNDTIALPAGSVTWWTESLEIQNKRLHLVGAGTNQTFIARGTNSNCLFWLHKMGDGNSTQGLLEITGITFDCGTSPTYGVIEVGNMTETNRNYRIHNCNFTNINRRALSTFGLQQGLIDHCYFQSTTNSNAGAVLINGLQRAGLGNPGLYTGTNDVYALGTYSDFCYLEDNVFNMTSVSPPGDDSAITTAYDAHCVMRHNWTTNSNFDVHSEPGQGRTAPLWEIYNNYFFMTWNGRGSWTDVRTGWGVHYSNTVVATAAFQVPGLMIYEQRATATNVFTNAYPAPQHYQVPGCSWITGTNTSDGNSNSIALGYPALDQVGWGDPIVFYRDHAGQTFHGAYQWSNTFNGTNLAWYIQTVGTNTGWYGWHGQQLPCPLDLFKLGRDFFNDTPKPGYSATAYPHPFQFGGTAGAPDPQITQNPANVTVNAGQPATFTVSASGTARLSYQWTQNGSPIPGATTNSYIVSAQPSMNGYRFKCIVANSLGSVTSAAATLGVNSGSLVPPAPTDLKAISRAR